MLLEKLFAARELAAYSGYASTRKVQVPENEKKTLVTVSTHLVQLDSEMQYPIPKTPLAIMGTIQ